MKIQDLHSQIMPIIGLATEVYSSKGGILIIPAQYNLNGQTILIAGASSGMGRATAIATAAAGANVVLTARNAEALGVVCTSIQQCGGKARAVPVDLTDRTAV